MPLATDLSSDRRKWELTRTLISAALVVEAISRRIRVPRGTAKSIYQPRVEFFDDKISRGDYILCSFSKKARVIFSFNVDPL